MDMQTKILTHLANLAQSGGLDFVQQSSQYHNVGDVLIQRGFTTLTKLTYNFQRSYAVIEMDGKPVVEELDYTDSAAVIGTINTIVEHIAEVAGLELIRGDAHGSAE